MLVTHAHEDAGRGVHGGHLMDHWHSLLYERCVSYLASNRRARARGSTYRAINKLDEVHVYVAVGRAIVPIRETPLVGSIPKIRRTLSVT